MEHSFHFRANNLTFHSLWSKRCLRSFIHLALVDKILCWSQLHNSSQPWKLLKRMEEWARPSIFWNSNPAWPSSSTMEQYVKFRFGSLSNHSNAIKEQMPFRFKKTAQLSKKTIFLWDTSSLYKWSLIHKYCNYKYCLIWFLKHDIPTTLVNFFSSDNLY